MIDIYGVFKTNLRRYSVYKLIRRSDKKLRWIYLESLTTLEMALSRYPNAIPIDGVYLFRGSLEYNEDQLK